MPGITVWLKTEDNPQLSLWQSQLEVATNRINRDTSSILFLEKYLYEVTHRVVLVDKKKRMALWRGAAEPPCPQACV